MISACLSAVARGLVRRGIARAAAARLLRIDRETVERVLRRRDPIPELIVTRRCPDCGGLVTGLVCLACRTRQTKRSGGR